MHNNRYQLIHVMPAPTSNPPAISADELAAVLRAAASGTLPVRIDDYRPWDEIYCGDLGIWFGAWYVVIFNDCNQLDYVDEARAPDGRTTSFDEWGDRNPLDVLSLYEENRLYDAVRAAALTPRS
jgi:hypothetical protein